MTRFCLRAIALGLVGAILPACGVGGQGTLRPTVAPGIPASVSAAAGNKQADFRGTRTPDAPGGLLTAPRRDTASSRDTLR